MADLTSSDVLNSESKEMRALAQRIVAARANGMSYADLEKEFGLRDNNGMNSYRICAALSGKKPAAGKVPPVQPTKTASRNVESSLGKGMETIRCLSVKQPYASAIASGEKKIEYRTWSTEYRGDILIHASKVDAEPCPSDLPRGVSVCIVELYDVKGSEGDYQWKLRNPRMVKQCPFVGVPGVLYGVNDDNGTYYRTVKADASPS